MIEMNVSTSHLVYTIVLDQGFNTSAQNVGAHKYSRGFPYYPTFTAHHIFMSNFQMKHHIITMLPKQWLK